MRGNSSISFTAHVVSGAGRGKKIGAPTINLAVTDVPADLQEGIYACFVDVGETEKYPAAMHYGPPIFYSTDVTCEVHVIDQSIQKAPERVRIEIIEYLRPIQNFDSEQQLIAQIQKDLGRARAILLA